jgi:two-component system chemotaxis response regulator CheV
MSDLFEEIEERTTLALTNQMEMLTFHLTDSQIYGINVFKVIEVLECPDKIIKMPQSHYAINGVIDHRGKPINIIDLSLSLGLTPVNYREEMGHIIVCEYNNAVQGFLIKNPDKLITKSWDEIKSPTGMLSSYGYLTSLAYTDEGETIQMLDIEKILAEVLEMDHGLSEEMMEQIRKTDYSHFHAIGVDDSKTARTMLQSVFDGIGLNYQLMDHAAKALEYLEALSDEEIKKHRLIISDIEMPGMDGFTFTRKLKEIPRLSGIHVMLHSSMSNKSNMLKAKQVGADEFLAKFHPDSLAEKIIEKFK